MAWIKRPSFPAAVVAGAFGLASLLASPPVRAGAPQHGIVPHRGVVDIGASPSCSSPVASYFGGPILQSPTIVAVFWNSDVNALLRAKIGQFYADVTVSSYWPWLQEYDTVGLTSTSNQVILPGRSGGSFVLAPSRCGAGTTGTCQLTDAEVQAELASQIASGTLPAPTIDCTGNNDTVYMIDFPPKVTLDGSCTVYCAYHNTGTYGASNIPLVYAVLMDTFTGPCTTGCGTNATALDNATEIASHELVEAVTDPNVGLDTQNVYARPAAWADNNNGCGELGDICEGTSPGDTITVGGRTWTVQEMWSNQQQRCTSTGSSPPVCAGTTLSGCRRCSCADTGHACTGPTPSCETTSTNVLFGACEQCTASNGTCGAGEVCAQSSAEQQDDVCAASATTVPALGDKTPILAALLLLGGSLRAGLRRRTIS